MGGELAFESEPGRGTTFFFTALLGVQEQQDNPTISVPEGLRDRKALVVEDTVSSRELLETFFGRFAMPCTSVDSAEKALELLQSQNRPGAKNPFKMVLLDWQLPGMNGLDAATTIRGQEQTHDLPIILMSAYAGKEEEAHCAEAGVNVFLPKPITASSLFNAIVEATGMPPASPNKASLDTQEFAGTHVLLAEDNEINQFVALEMLGRLGIELEVAANGREAAEMVRRKPYAAVLMDMQMPEMDGLEATREIRRSPEFRNLPIIAMTANAMKSDVEACLAAGMNDFLSKPIDRAALIQSLRRWLPPTAGRIDAPSHIIPELSEPDREAAKLVMPVLEGIDVAGTVRRLGIPYERLRTVLLRFSADQPQKLESLRSAVAAGDLSAARQHAHALAGAAGNLGADELRQLARAIELAAKEGDRDLADRMRRLEECASIVLRSIETLRNGSDQAEGRPIDAASPINRTRVGELLQRLQSALVDQEVTGSAKMLEELVRLNLPAQYREPIDRLRELIDGYEFDRAAEIVGRLLADLSSGEIS